MKRRTFIQLASAGASAAALPQFSLAMSTSPRYDYVLTASEHVLTLVDGGTSPGLAFNGQFPAPVIRAKQGKPLRIHFINKLKQETTIHWHGIRLNNAMDGVPYLTQPPIKPGASFDYEFTCPDAGTFWYHPHMHSIEQLGKGLVGALIVEETKAQDFDEEVILGFKDWRLNKDGSFMRLSEPRHAARAGTLGNIATINGEQLPVIDVPGNARIRLRLLNMDNSRQFAISLRGSNATVLAIDAMPVAPQALSTHELGVGMRLDIGLITPAETGTEIPVYDVKGRFLQKVCTLRVSDTSLRKTAPPAFSALPPNPVSEPDLARAEKLSFVFEWAGAMTPASDEGHSMQEFWTINRRAWSDMNHENLPEPLAELSLGKSYIFELYNATPHTHPIHLHGLIFKVLKSDKKDVSPFFTDTVLLEKNERAQIALVADNPGQWMYHCHVIEHMKTGLMGYVRVS
jgi:FtsP/CotA-like multicopper oxidase with cupredoxin domain